MSPNAPRGPRTHFTPYMGPKYDVLTYHQKLTNSAILPCYTLIEARKNWLLKMSYINWVQSRPRLQSTISLCNNVFFPYNTLVFVKTNREGGSNSVGGCSRPPISSCCYGIFRRFWPRRWRRTAHDNLEHTVRNLRFLSKNFNFDFPRKLSIFFLGEKLVKMLWFWTF